MAKRSRRPSSSSSRAPKDWVYNELSYTATSAHTMAPGSGPGNPGIFPLTVSQNQRMIALAGTPGAVPLGATYQSWAAIAEGGHQRVYAVEGHIDMDPTTWNVGQSFRVGWRLLYEQINPTTGGFLLPTGYSMWLNSAAGGTVAQFANSGFLKEGYLSDANIAGTAVTSRGTWRLPIRWSSKRGVRLSDDRAILLWVESAAGSITLRLLPRMRALVASAS